MTDLAFARRIRGAVLGVAVVVFCLLAPSAAAQDVSEQQLETFERYVAEASELIDEGDYEAGIERFEQAREIIDHPRLSVAIADAYLQWNRCAQAEAQYERLLDRDDLGEQRREAVGAGLREARTDCTQMAILQIECAPDETTLRIQDADVTDAACPFEGDVPTGELEVEAEAADHVGVVETVAVDREGPNRHQFDLMHVDEASGPDWAPVATWGTMGVGGALLVGGLISDYRTGNRIEEAAQARDDGDYQRLEQLESDADSARTRTALLYTGGGLLMAGGLALHLVGVDTLFGDEPDQGAATLEVGPGTVRTIVRW